MASLDNGKSTSHAHVAETSGKLHSSLGTSVIKMYKVLETTLLLIAGLPFPLDPTDLHNRFLFCLNLRNTEQASLRLNHEEIHSAFSCVVWCNKVLQNEHIFSRRRQVSENEMQN